MTQCTACKGLRCFVPSSSTTSSKISFGASAMLRIKAPHRPLRLRRFLDLRRLPRRQSLRLRQRRQRLRVSHPYAHSLRRAVRLGDPQLDHEYQVRKEWIPHQVPRVRLHDRLAPSPTKAPRPAPSPSNPTLLFNSVPIIKLAILHPAHQYPSTNPSQSQKPNQNSPPSRAKTRNLPPLPTPNLARKR